MKYLLDTNILSETIKKFPNPKVIEWLESVPQNQLYISVLTIGEIRKGAEKLDNGKKKQKLLHWLDVELLSWFQMNIISIDQEIANKWGHVLATNPRTLPAIDSLIAASAVANNLTLVTRNARDFKNIAGLEILNPWGGDPSWFL